MKSETRHKLQTNILADKAGHAIETTRPYALWLTMGITALALFGLIFGWMQNSAHKKNASAWAEFFFAAKDARDLVPVYEEYPGTSAASWAMQAEADSNLARGLEMIYLDRTESDELAKKAKSGYEKVLASTRESMLRLRATVGLAQSYEALGEIDKSIAEYKKLLAMDGVQAALAADVQRRIEWLQNKDGQEFYAWYKDFRPSPSPPVSVPSDLKNLPKDPDLQFQPTTPTVKATSDPPVENSPSTQGSPSAIQPTSQAPISEAPASDAPAAEVPAAADSQLPKSNE